MAINLKIQSIIELINTNPIELDLTGMLRKIPIVKAKELLELINNNCTNLVHLKLNDVNLSMLNDDLENVLFDKLIKLEHLELRNCKLNNINNIKFPINLKTIDLSKNVKKLKYNSHNIICKLLLTLPNLDNVMIEGRGTLD